MLSSSPRMFSAVTATVLIVLAAALTPAVAGPNDSDWVQMFNPKDTSLATNWDIHIQGAGLNADTKNTFRRSIIGSDTVLEVNYGNYTGNFTFGHIGYKIRPFDYFIVRVEHQFVGATQTGGNPGSWALQNNGIMHHSQSVASMGLNQNFPISMEAQLLGPANTGADNNSTMNLCTPGTSFYTTATGGSQNNTHCNSALTHDRSATLAPNWAVASVYALSDSIIRYYYRDTLVYTYYRPVEYNGDNQVTGSTVTITPGKPIKGGYILLQSESHATRFRRVEVLNLAGCMTPGDVNYKSYLVKHDSTACGGTSGIRGNSPQNARYVAPMTVVGNAIKVGGTERVTVEMFDVQGTLIGRHTAQAPFLWKPSAATSGLHMIRAITPRGVYTERVTLF